MRRKPLKLPGVQPNVGLELAYRRKLEKLIEEMVKSTNYWLGVAYRGNAPEMAADSSPAMALREVMRRLARRWQARFDAASLDLAQYFATAAADRSDRALAAILKEGGFSVKFGSTRAFNDVLQAAIGENVSLIRSISSQYFTQVEGAVMRSVQSGRDLHTLSKGLAERYKITAKRAALIARDQNNKATAVITRERRMELGITQSIWLHSHAGKEPRPTHVAFNGKTYDEAKGMYDKDANGPGKGAWVHPGELINCRCVSQPLIEGFTL